MFVGRKSPHNKENRLLDVKPITCPMRLRRTDSLISMESSLTDSMVSLTNILTDSTSNLNVSACFENSRVEESIACLNLNFKRRKSVRFDEDNNSMHENEPLPLKRKESATKIPVPILKKKSSLDGSFRENSQVSVSNASFALRSDRVPVSKMPIPRTSLLDDRINERKRYVSLLENLKKTRKKYYDDIFPPEAASLYYSPKDTKYGEVKWVRASQICHGKYSSLFSRAIEDRCLVGNGEVPLDYMAVAMTVVGNTVGCLERLFEGEHTSDYGIYLVRLFIEGVWRYVIIDDYLPVVTKDRKLVPVFLSTQQKTKNGLELWPHLLQKAFAKVYSTYEALTNGNLEDLLNELTGSVVDRTEFKRPMAMDIALQKQIASSVTCVVVGKQLKSCKTPGEKQYNYYPVLKPSSSNILDQLSDSMSVYVGHSNETLHPSELPSAYQLLLICRIQHGNYHSTCNLKQTTKDPISVRSFTVESTTGCDITLTQKDRKFFRQGYQYSWARIMIAMKESDGYRWIAGRYSRGKLISMQCLLDPGKYYVVVMVDWVGSRTYDMRLNYSGNAQIQSLERVPQVSALGILTDICVDLSQRFGDFRQLSEQLCSYWHIDSNLGLIIDNINNESNRSASFKKSYDRSMRILTGLKGVNEDFVRNGNKIVATIAPKDHYTLIVRVNRGEDLEVLDCFGLDDH